MKGAFRPPCFCSSGSFTPIKFLPISPSVGILNSCQTHLFLAQASAARALFAQSKLRGWARPNPGQSLGEQRRVHRQRTETSEPTMRLHRLRARLSAVACGLLLLLVQGQGEAPAEGRQGLESDLPNAAEAEPDSAGGKAPGRWELVEMTAWNS